MGSTQRSNLKGQPHILFVDDEQRLRRLAERLFKPYDVTVTTCSDAQAAIAALARHEIDLVITDFKLPGMDGTELLARVREQHPDVQTVILTSHSSIQHAVRSMQQGASDYIPKPFSTTDLVNRVMQLLRERPSTAGRSQAPEQQASPRKMLFDKQLVGEHPSIQKIQSLLPRIASSAAPVFIHGESGTGKEILARLVHRMSARSQEQFVALNCAILPSELVESHLFGHRKGAFTGAVSDMTGAFEGAHRGTLLLDEITEVDSSVQAKLLRVLQEREIQRVGETELIPVDVRIVATSNVDVQEAIRERRFREDLYHRLSVFPITIPPLRERLSDVPVLAEHFIRKYCSLYDLPSKTISASLLRRLCAYSWPGNVRQLENMLHRGVVLSAEDGEIRFEHVANDFLEESMPTGSGVNGGSMTLEDLERQAILQTLKQTGHNQKEAAERLGISDRTIRNKLKKYREEGYFV